MHMIIYQSCSLSTEIYFFYIFEIEILMITCSFNGGESETLGYSSIL